MPVRLRLRRQGRGKSPHYAIVAADSRSPRDGRFIEKVGFYNPVKSPAELFIDHELALKWLGYGAQPTDTVNGLLRHSGITLKFALRKQGKSEDVQKSIFEGWWAANGAKKAEKFNFITVEHTKGKEAHHGGDLNH